MSTWTKEKEIALINKMQDEYVDELIQKLHSTESSEAAMKFINFTSPTGTGKTKMMAKLINKLSDDFFIITTLSKGQLNQQVQNSLNKDCYHDNYVVFGSMSLKTNSIMKEKDLIDILPLDKKVYWIRDEGHINTNKWSTVLESKCTKIINFSATNKEGGGIVCNFMNTLMLRTVTQKTGDIDAALQKLIEVKKIHEDISGYNPCALFRVMSNNVEQEVLKKCEEYNLKAVTLIDNDDHRTADLCKDNNEYDVIINKQKITEGIDIRRAHVLWMENQPNNIATTIQAIGRCRRNALLWRDDIDILAPENKKLLEQTRECFVYYNVKNMKVDTDETGELAIEFCPYISVERLKPGHTIYVEDGQMPNGLIIAELMGCTGNYKITKDPKYGFNQVENPEIYKIQRLLTHVYNTDYNELAQLLSNHQSKYCQNFLKSYQENKFGEIYINGKFTKGISFRVNSNRPNYIFVCNKELKELFFMISNKASFQKIMDFLIKNSLYKNSSFSKDDVDEKYKVFNSVYNNRLLGLLNYDDYQQKKYEVKLYSIGIESDIEDKIEWIQQRSITAQFNRHSKLNRYIESQYGKEIEQAKYKLYSGKNNFKFTKKMNSCLGYCSEYYAKYILFGEEYLNPYLKEIKEYFQIVNEKAMIVQACMRKYRNMMYQVFPKISPKHIPSFSYKQLSKDEMKDFVDTVIRLGTKAAEFCKNKIDITNARNTNPILQTAPFVGLADLIDQETIIDIKCTNHIDINMIKQVLAYQFLSLFRSDLHIKRVIVYDAVADKFVEIPITEKNQKIPE